MVFVKYLLGKTGLFPKCLPQVNDVLEAALDSYEISRVKTPRGVRYFYVVPTFPDNREMVAKLLRTFRANGVILHAHFSKHYNMRVYRVRDRGQQFMRDVIKVNQDAGQFQNIMKYRIQEITMAPNMLVKLLGRREK